MTKTSFTPSNPAIAACTCGCGLWLNMGGTWEHYTPEYRESKIKKSRRYHLAEGQGDDCQRSPAHPVPEYGHAIREHMDGADNWLINFENSVVRQFQLVDSAFVAVELTPPPF